MDWVQVDAAVGVTLALLGVILAIGRAVFKWIRGFDKRWDTFMRDWAGTPAEPGRDAVPGVMERLNRMDGELKHNGGSTMKDAVKRIEKKLDGIETRLIAGDNRFNEVESRIEELEQGDVNEHR
jgi:hypothetical protein